MNEILVLGAGLVARPLVGYLLKHNYQVKVASRTLSKAEALIGEHPNGEAQRIVVKDRAALSALITQADVVVSLLPYTHHVNVAKLCIEHHKHMVTTSYVSDEMRALDKQADRGDILILNECGLDPGIDHMSAMKIIHRVKAPGGEIKSFASYCGGLPAPEANTNPLGYKFSWSPRGVALAAKNGARYLKDKREMVISPGRLFENYDIIDIGGLGEFEVYPNRNSLSYIEKYDIGTTETMFRGTLRNIGWCDTWQAITALGWLDENVKRDMTDTTFSAFLRTLIDAPPDKELKAALTSHLGLAPSSSVVEKLEWLGLLSDERLPLRERSPLDILVARLQEKLRYEAGERDMIILHHEFVASYPAEQRTEKITSTLTSFGIPKGETAMARTVGLPAAIAVKSIVDGTIELRGVHIPVDPRLYEPILRELEQEGIRFVESVHPL